ncbi:hypothetical protein Golob_025042, partial [Gossypium lobatum]|nr:hypothetical protein [Gossypium lobatum]
LALEDEAGCSGVLREDKGVACLLFSWRTEYTKSKMIGIMAIKTTVDMYIGLCRKVNVPLVIKFCSSVALEWLMNRSYRPWLLWKLFEDINYGTNQLAQFQFKYIHRQGNGMEDALVKAGISRSSFFKAWW